MCNAWNHSPGCNCGWGGGGGWSSNSWAGMGNGGYVSSVYNAESSYTLDSSDFCRETSCPRCGSSVYFIRHNGGSVWVDHLGWPWPKHSCFADEAPSPANDLIERLARQGIGLSESMRLGRVRHRFTKGSNRIYLIECLDKKVLALSASLSTPSIHYNLVLVVPTISNTFLYDGVRPLIRVHHYQISGPIIKQMLELTMINADLLLTRHAPKSEMTCCPICQSPVRKDRLERHLLRVHKAKSQGLSR